MISTNIHETVFDKLALPKNFKDIYDNRYGLSISFIENIIKGAFKNKFDFITFEFNIFEVAKAIKDEIKTLYLFNKGVPISRWSNTYNHDKFDEEIISAIYTGYSKSQDTLFVENRINLQTMPFSLNSKTYAEYYEFYNYILFRIPDLSTQDALIISGGYVDHIDYFITEDKRLTEVWKSFTKEDKNIKGNPLIEIKNPGDSMFKAPK